MFKYSDSSLKLIINRDIPYRQRHLVPKYFVQHEIKKIIIIRNTEFYASQRLLSCRHLQKTTGRKHMLQEIVNL